MNLPNLRTFLSGNKSAKDLDNQESKLSDASRKHKDSPGRALYYNRAIHTSIRLKTLIVLCATFMCLILILVMYSQTVILGGFTKLEQNDVTENIARVSNAIDSDGSKLNSIAYAWATSNEIVNFTRTDSEKRLNDYFPNDKLASSKINILAIYRNGVIRDHKYVNLQYGHQMPTPTSLLTQLSDNQAILTHTTSDSGINGVIMLNSGPMLIASRTIVDQNTKENIGTLVVGRYLDTAAIADLSDRTQLAISLSGPGDQGLPTGPGVATQLSRNGDMVSIRPVDEDTISGYTLVRDIFGNPALILGIKIPRVIYNQGKTSVQYALLGLVLIGLVFLIATMVLIETTLLRRLGNLTGRIRKIGSKGEINSRLPPDGDDEIGSVASSVNGMLESIDQSHQLLAKSEERYAGLIETARDMIFTCNSDGTFTSINQVGEALTGYPRNGIIGNNLEELFTPESANLIMEVCRRDITSTWDITLYEMVMVAKGGHRVILEVSLQLQVQEDGSNYIFAIARDISGRKQIEADLELHRQNLEELVTERTRNLSDANLWLKNEIVERQRAEEDLAAEKTRLEITISSIADGVIATDNDGIIILANRVAGDLVNYRTDELYGLPISGVLQFIDIRSKKRVDNPVEKVLREGASIEITNNIALVDEQGKETPVSLSAAPTRDPNEVTIGAVMVIRDITERLRWEDEIQRSAKLESVGTLAGGIAHDFNNILMAISGNIALAKTMVSQDSEIFARLEGAEEASIRAKSITKQLLTFAKGGGPVKDTADIKELIRETSEFVLRGSKSRAKITIAPDLSPVYVDSGQISQVIGNIVMNANQAMPNGGMISILAENVHFDVSHGMIPPGRYVRISVIDQGVGIPKENIAKIFEPWFTTKQTGTGLGLTSVLSIIKKHDGYIDIQSEPGNGTTFFIYLPSSDAALLAPDVVKIDLLHSGSKKILLMDDDEQVLFVLQALLRKHGFEVTGARDGAEAIKMFAQEYESGVPFDVVIMDLTVPGGMGGEECMRHLTQQHPGIVAMVTSGYSDNSIMANYQSYGFSGVIEKPYKIDQLVEKLNHLIGSGITNGSRARG